LPYYSYYFPPQVLLGVGDVYVCKEKEINIAGYKAERILFWRQDSFEIKDKKKLEGSLDTSHTGHFTVHTQDYFLAINPYQDGHFLETFDGSTYTTHFVAPNWSFTSIYPCNKF